MPNALLFLTSEESPRTSLSPWAVAKRSSVRSASNFAALSPKPGDPSEPRLLGHDVIRVLVRGSSGIRAKGRTSLREDGAARRRALHERLHIGRSPGWSAQGRLPAASEPNSRVL